MFAESATFLSIFAVIDINKNWACQITFSKSILDVPIIGKTFLPSLTDIMILAGDEYINGKLVKNTLSGSVKNKD